MEYKMLRLVAFMGASFLPLVIAVIAGVSTYLLFGNDLLGVGIITGIAALFGVLLCGLAGYQITGQNPWVKAVQGEAMLMFGYSSSGVGQIFTCKTKNNPSGGIDIVTTINKEDVVLAYDKPMSYRIMQPVNAFIELIHPKKQVDASGKEFDGKATTQITIPNEDFDKYVMRFGYLTVLFFNFETGTLTNKFAVNELEKFYAMKYLSLHLDRKMDIYIAELRMARKNFFDALLNKLSAFMKSPMFPVLMVLIVGFFVVVFIAMMWPQISGFIGGAMPSIGGKGVDANIIAPITRGAITPLTN